MQQESPHPRRFTESTLGTIAACLLALLWIASMTMVDSHVYSTAPYVACLVPIVALWALAVVCGFKLVRLRLVSWLSLAAGGYFLVRSHTGYSVVEAWQDTGLILGCFVFYIAGVYAGQGDSSRRIMAAIMVALVLNAVSLYLTDMGRPLPWSLRPEYSVCGPTTRNTALFTYKNFAGFFLLTAGMLPLCRMCCTKGFHLRDGLLTLLGFGAAGLAFGVGTRVVWGLLPCLLVFIWLQRLLVCLAENRRVGILLVVTGIGLFVGGAMLVYDFMFERNVVNAIMQVDTHLRTMAWDLACNVAPNGGWCGFGARTAQWEIVQGFNEWSSPNLVHNEYLQAWVDYGTVGISLLGAILLFHFIIGLRQLTAEHVENARRAKVAMALMFLLSACLYSICDFTWHQAALSTATAFSCGIMASPYPMKPFRWREIGRNWAPGSGASLAPVRAQGLAARLLLLALGVALAVDMAGICRSTAPAWLASWKYDTMVREGAPIQERLALLEEVHTVYPDSMLIDHYVIQPMPKGKGWNTLESMLIRTLEANPRQVFMSIMLADLWGRDGRFEEAEKLLRRAYDGDGTTSCRTNSWAFYYNFNLIRWGQKKMFEGDFPTALSMLEYGFAISRSHEARLPNTAWRTGFKPWENGWTKKVRESIYKVAENDLKMLKSMGVQPDHSWQEPMEKGGKPALYRRWNPSPH